MGSNVFGMFVAALAVVSSGMQQIYVGTMQAKHKLNANELLSNTAPAQARAPPCCKPRSIAEPSPFFPPWGAVSAGLVRRCDRLHCVLQSCLHCQT